MKLTDYLKANNLPDFITSWQEVEEFTGIDTTDLQDAAPVTVAPGKAAPEPVTVVKPAPVTVVKPAPVKTAPVVVKQPDTGLETIANALAPYMQLQQNIDENAILELIKTHTPSIDQNDIIKLIQTHAPKPYVKEINITVNEIKTTVAGAQHEQFEKILKIMSAGINPYLWGPAGTGKTQLVHSAATALNKDFYCISVCAQSTKSDLMGFISANANYVRTLFREAYEKGGVFLLDEIDNGNPNVLASMNAALANGYCAFPDGMIKKHPDFLCCAAANTFGTGANREYVGRNQIDAATLNRFMQVAIDYDKNLEVLLFGDIAKDIQKMRDKLKGERAIISMRNIIHTVKLMGVGYSKHEALQMAVIDTIPENLQSKI